MRERINNEMRGTKGDIEEYINARIDMVKLHTAEGVSKFISTILVRMVVLYVMFFVLLFASVAVSFWLGEIFDSKAIGFIIIAGFYLFVGLIVIALRRFIIERPVITSIIHLLFPNYGHYDEEK